MHDSVGNNESSLSQQIHYLQFSNLKKSSIARLITTSSERVLTNFFFKIYVIKLHRCLVSSIQRILTLRGLIMIQGRNVRLGSSLLVQCDPVDSLLGTQRNNDDNDHTADNDRGNHTAGDSSSLGGSRQALTRATVDTRDTLLANASAILLADASAGAVVGALAGLEHYRTSTRGDTSATLNSNAADGANSCSSTVVPFTLIAITILASTAKITVRERRADGLRKIDDCDTAVSTTVVNCGIRNRGSKTGGANAHSIIAHTMPIAVART
jgi:hypothetical protein